MRGRHLTENDAMSMTCSPRVEHADQVTVYTDSLLRASLVVEADGQLWIVPRSEGGWSRRQRLRLTDDARAERLRPARGVSADWLGVPSDHASAITA